MGHYWLRPNKLSYWSAMKKDFLLHVTDYTYLVPSDKHNLTMTTATKLGFFFAVWCCFGPRGVVWHVAIHTMHYLWTEEVRHAHVSTCFVQRSFFLELSTKNACQSNALLRLNSMPQSTLFNPGSLVSIYTAYWRNCHVMNKLRTKERPNTKLGIANQ